MLNYPPKPQRRRRNWLDGAPWGNMAFFAALLCSVGVMVFADVHTQTQEVTPRSPLTVERGSVHRFEKTLIGIQGIIEENNNRHRFKVKFDDGSVKEFSMSPLDSMPASRFFDRASYCIYTQGHLIRTVYFETRESFRGYNSFEGIRDPNDDGTCPVFPVD